MRLHRFRRLYVADLDAICGHGDNTRCVRDISHRYPYLKIWLDNGLQPYPMPHRASHQCVQPVVGSESLSDARLRELSAALRSANAPVLSLDFQHDAFLGPPALLADAGLWPTRVIAMALARVGSGVGPDLQRLRALAARSPHATWYAGGGVRHSRDLRDLEHAGVHGALLASALHDGVIGAETLAAYG